MPSEPIIDIQALRVAYGSTEVLKGIDLAIERGTFVALLGASGCGKTTLLRTLSGFMPAASGRIRVDGRDITALPPERRGIAMVFQSYALWSHMNVAANIGYGLKLRGVHRDRIAERVEAMLSMLGLSGYGARRVDALSGGQRQRVALGRALAIEPQILLLDEPLSNLDARVRLQMRHEIRSLQRKLGVTAVLVTHDREEAMSMADRVVVLDQGLIAQQGTPQELFQRPASPHVAAFMGAENVIEAEGAFRAGALDLRIPAQPPARLAGAHVARLPDHGAGAVCVHFRSEAASLVRTGADGAATADNALHLDGVVDQVSYLGERYRCAVRTGCGEFLVDHPEPIAPDQAVTVCVPAQALHVYARDASAPS
ncbi:MAG TPA: ABC transporter ATP-binding protein [Albitalea sp.]|uniref:ABC transporter ATP-binding protein n=1 Tax=Piscinibacter sp. TaxID=1903157 RepID=UPI002ED29A49